MINLERKKNQLFLDQIIKRDGIELKGKGNVLIKSPVGSGKTNFILENLSKQYSGKKLLLVSTSMLEEELGLEEGIKKIKNINPKSTNTEDVILMTYSSFGHKILFDDRLLEGVDVIFCDEVHSLFDYYLKHKAPVYSASIKALFKKYEDKDIFYFTATDKKLDDFINKEYEDIYRDLEIIDYNENKDILKYTDLYKGTFSGPDGVKTVIDKLNHFKENGKKGVIFNEKISGMQGIEEYLACKGYKAISIWSINNTETPMNDEQLYVRSMLLKTKMIPDGYDFIIINEAMREGWNLKDPNVELVILNTLDETNQEQARGRVRKDISFLLTKVKEEVTPLITRILNREKTLGVIAKNINKQLTKADKDEIVKELDIRREENNVLVKWNTIKKAILTDERYNIEEKVTRIDGKQTKVCIITEKEREVPLSDKVKAKNFMKKIIKSNFGRDNEEFLNKYIKENPAIAFSHISSSYFTFVTQEGWTERKYADVTYLLAKNKKIFSKKNYREYGYKKYNTLSELEIVYERVKYEPYAINDLNILRVKKEMNDRRIEVELLDYIGTNELK